MKRIILLLSLLTPTSALAQPPGPAPGIPQVGTLTGAQSFLCSMNNAAGANIQLTGTWTGTVNFEYSVDGATWNALTVNPQGGGSSVTSAVANGNWFFSNTGFVTFGVRTRAGTISVGTASVVCTTVANGASSSATVTGTASTTIVDSNNVNAVPASKNAVRVTGIESGDAVNVSPVDASGNPIIPSVCGNDSIVASKAISTSSSGYTNLVSVSGSTVIYVCGYQLVSTAANSVKFAYGTTSSTPCDTNEVDLTGAMAFAANGGIAVSSAGATQFKTIGARQLCINLTGGTQVSGVVTYVQQ